MNLRYLGLVPNVRQIHHPKIEDIFYHILKINRRNKRLSGYNYRLINMTARTIHNVCF